jgi:hypothetical protein
MAILSMKRLQSVTGLLEMDRSLFGDQRFLLGSWSEVTMI